MGASFIVHGMQLCQENSVNEFNIEAMSCGHCASTITKTVKLLDPQAKVEVDLGRKLVKVESREDRATISAALTEAGYPPA